MMEILNYVLIDDYEIDTNDDTYSMEYQEFIDWKSSYLNNSGILWFEIGNVDADQSGWNQIVRYVNGVGDRDIVDPLNSLNNHEQISNHEQVKSVVEQVTNLTNNVDLQANSSNVQDIKTKTKKQQIKDRQE